MRVWELGRLAVAVVVVGVGCQAPAPRVTVQDGPHAQVFAITPSDSDLVYLGRVVWQAADEGDVWVVAAERPFALGERARFAYGTVPSGFVQVVPVDGESPRRPLGAQEGAILFYEEDQLPIRILDEDGDPRTVLLIPGPGQSSEVSRIEWRDCESNEVLWSLVATTPVRVAGGASLTYGSVPYGFVQAFPRGGLFPCDLAKRNPKIVAYMERPYGGVLVSVRNGRFSLGH